MALLLPRDNDGERMLLFALNSTKMAVMLESGFLAFEREGNTAWKGVHVPHVHVEIDPASLSASQGFRSPLGSMVRHDSSLSINGRRGHGSPTIAVPLLDNLPPCTSDYAATFLRWQIVVGEGIEKQVLHQVDVTPKT
ncbi:hypothetical protein [Sphingobium lactosutens]|uniref:Uncharacterized protein n=1 Tax=Sphingobium lactosutens DS20 TaxID=1331060 RepID=T0J4P6_9SPHN|nr:hypothetical protein [Sphingobium lactosutens]EQB16929.1 hypothetical protein RLDS_05705 [Sphingobium lactosutens DS20]